MSNQTATQTSDPLAVQLGYLRGVLTAQTGDLTQEESLFQPEGGGNCVNWLVGHIVVSRDMMLEIVGRPPLLDAATRARYAQGSEPISGPGEGVEELSRLLATYKESQGPILEGMAAMSAADRATMIPWFGAEMDKRGALGGLLFHEAYHVGQAGLLRRLLGKASAIGR